MAYVNHITALDETPQEFLAFSGPLSVTSGNIVTLVIGIYTTAQRTIGVTGAGTTGWTQDTSGGIYHDDDDWQVAVFRGVASSTGNLTPNIAIPGGHAGYAVAVLAQFDNYDSYLGAVTNRQASPGTGAGAVTTGNVNITSQPARQIGVFLNFIGGEAPNAANGSQHGSDLWGGNGMLSSRLVEATGNSAATATVASGQGAVIHYSTQIAFVESGEAGEDYDGGSDATVEVDSEGAGTLAAQGGSASTVEVSATGAGEALRVGIRTATIKEPNQNDQDVENASNVTVRIWYADSISGAPDQVLTNQPITSGVLEFPVTAAEDDPVSYQARWMTGDEPAEDRFFEVIDDTAIDLDEE